MGTMKEKNSTASSIEYLILALLTAVYTALQIRHSIACGMLSVPLTYDDVGYFGEALHRVQHWYDHGFRGLLTDFLRNPPHSPWSTLLCMVGIAIIGPYQWAPAVMLGVFLFFILAWIYGYWLTQLESKFLRACCILVVLSWPILTHSVIDYRPDLPTSFFTICSLFMLLEATILDNKRKLIIAGTFFALALFSKPTFAPIIIVMVGWAYLLAIVHHQYELTSDLFSWPFNRKNLMSLGYFLLPVLIITLPIYIVSWHDLLSYFQSVLGHQVTSKGLWQVQGSLLTQMNYYLFGSSGHFLMGNVWRYLSPAIIVILGAWLIKKTPPYRALAIVATLVFAVVYGIVTLQKMKTLFFGVFVQWFLALGSLLVLIASLQMLSNKPNKRLLNIGMLFFSLVTFIATFNWEIYYRISGGYKACPTKIARFEYHRLNKIIRFLSHYKKPTEVFISLPGPYLNPDILEIERVKHGLENITFTQLVYEDNLASFKKYVHSADVVIAFSEKDPELFIWEYNRDYRKDIMRMICQNHALKLVEVLKRPEKGETYIFAKNSKITREDLLAHQQQLCSSY
jgi:hypothetical protein